MFVETRGVIDTVLIERLVEMVRGRINHTVEVRGKIDVLATTRDLMPIIPYAASLAHQGLLGCVEMMDLGGNDDLTKIPAVHLASLVSCVTEQVNIRNVTGFRSHLVTLLDGVKSKMLMITRQKLGSEETRALVRAMESRVEKVYLYINIDTNVLLEYSGQGKCKDLWCDKAIVNDDMLRELRTWATTRNWLMTQDAYNIFLLKKSEISILKNIMN